MRHPGHPCGAPRWGTLAPLEKTILWEPGWRLGTRYNVGPARLQNARLFAIGIILEVDLVGAFIMNLTTVSGKWPKRTLQKWSREGSVAARPSPIILLYIVLTGRSGCDGCNGDFS